MSNFLPRTFNRMQSTSSLNRFFNSNRSTVTRSIITPFSSTSTLTSSITNRFFSSASKPEAFDVFQKLKDSPNGDNSPDTNSKRKPSDKVLKLADQIMSLTLIEAADLCDLCQDRLTPGDGSPIPGRMPFPHPQGMFGSGMPMMGMGMPQMGMAPAAPAAAPAAAAAEDDAPAEAETKKEETKAATGPVTLKLVSFEEGKKIGVIKEVRALTGLGLKESKDLVENAPKVLQKGVPREDAEGIVEKFKKAMAVVEYA